ncbi:MAG: helix-turn-helix domain-containing protein [Deltaproteobacteria bacterium]|jgi:AraC family transcriptional regulator of adaptative response / DNA-3-methyladenine glycosylase II|nr:helix-turn-helix domain-containing protein [Deltaproteobacteria bacterium]
MLANKDALYAAFLAKDPRFDGRVFVGISSTKVYCRPVCRAKQAKKENCTFFASAAQAEQAGYRPCLVCRPELAPGRAITDASARLAVRAARMLEERCGEAEGMSEIAAKLGTSDRHLRRVFQDEFGVPPVQYLQTSRLLLAKGLLTDTRLPVLEVAMASGFGSLRRFNDLFRRRYGIVPTDLRKPTGPKNVADAPVTLRLGYRPPYRWEAMLSFLEGRAISGVEAVRDGEYLRTVSLPSPGNDGGRVTGWLKVGNVADRNAISVTASETLMPVMPQVLSKVRRLFDLYCDPEAVYGALGSMNRIAPGLCLPGTRVPGAFDAFETAARAILGQQITVRAAGTLASRIAEELGEPVDTGIEGLARSFPGPESLAAMSGMPSGTGRESDGGAPQRTGRGPDRGKPVSSGHGPDHGDSGRSGRGPAHVHPPGSLEDCLGRLGVVSARSRAIGSLAEAVARGEVDLDLPQDPEEEMKKLTAIHGIGSWTAGYIGMRTGGWPDIFLETDAGIRKALPGRSPGELVKLAEEWRPWRSYATMNLWNSLSRKEEPK